ncbi:MAG: antibiotic biosynthesis monooxygenase [Myxococcales bacterium]|nr:antibiotic biosynthesis monooxygenase [Myxococcales bacterium]MCB9644941.1 antibiotic biosynthesis monooxygenase [Myxococcales bacterium]
MTLIQEGSGQLTLINVFHVQPEHQQELVELLVDATQATMKHLPGFLSANIHKSLDGKRVINYAQWESREHFDQMLQHPDALPHMKRAAQLAESYDPVLCDVISVHSVLS